MTLLSTFTHIFFLSIVFGYAFLCAVAITDLRMWVPIVLIGETAIGWIWGAITNDT